MPGRWRTRVGWGRTGPRIGRRQRSGWCERSSRCERRWCTRDRYINVVRAVLRQDGMRVPSGGAATFAARVRALALPAPQAAVVAPLLEVLAALHRELAAVEATVARGVARR